MSPRGLFESCSQVLPLQFNYDKWDTDSTERKSLLKVLEQIPDPMQDEDDQMLLAVLSAVYCAMHGIQPDDASEAAVAADVLRLIFDAGWELGKAEAAKEMI